MKHTSRITLAASLATVLLSSGLASAGDVAVINTNPGARIAIDENVGPIKNILPPPDASKVRAEAAASGLTPGFVPGSGPVGAGSSTRAWGSFGIPYTSTRVALGGSAYTGSFSTLGGAYLSTSDPYRRVGKLFMNGGYCSASVIRMGVIVTAAHCITNFGSSTLFGGWVFRPGHYGPTGATATQIAPYGAFPWVALVVPASWKAGTDIGSGSARDNDLAVIAVAKVGGQFIAQRTGYFGYGWNNYSFVSSSKTGNLSVAATSTLGYPALMDGGKIMQRADGPSYLTTVGGAGQIWQGNNFTGGSSGGPWIVNFVSADPALSGGAAIGNAATRSVIGVTSWGSSDPNATKDNYASQFRQNTRYPNASYGSPSRGAGNIGSLLATLCAAIIGGSSLQSQGYCN